MPLQLPINTRKSSRLAISEEPSRKSQTSLDFTPMVVVNRATVFAYPEDVSLVILTVFRGFLSYVLPPEVFT